MPSLKITNGTWEELQQAAKMIREQVFIQEQNIAAEDEWDEQDEIAVHFVVRIGAGVFMKMVRAVQHVWCSKLMILWAKVEQTDAKYATCHCPCSNSPSAL